MTMTHTSLLQFEVSEQVGTLNIISPSKPNALEPGMRDELAVACKTCRTPKPKPWPQAPPGTAKLWGVSSTSRCLCLRGQPGKIEVSSGFL
jgi:hypothetical protein